MGVNAFALPRRVVRVTSALLRELALALALTKGELNWRHWWVTKWDMSYIDILKRESCNNNC
jgi:hypothetical protein